MSKLKELIKEIYPAGVVFKSICQVTSVRRGKRVVKSQLEKSGVYPVYQNSLKPLGYYNQSNCPAKTAFVIGAGAAGEIGYSEVDFWAADDCYYISYCKELDSRYLYHVLLSKQQVLLSKVRKASIPRLSRSVIENLTIPVPPLEVQREIARILDNFTEHTEELKEELTARKQQYEYYRNELLCFKNKDVEYQKLGDLCTIKGRIGWQRLKKSEYLTKGDYYLVTGVDIRSDNRVNFGSCYYVSKERYEMDENIQLQNDDIILTKDGTIGKVAIIEDMDKPAVLNSHLFVIRDCSGKLNPKFLMYVLLSKRFSDFIKKNQTKGTIPGLTQAMMINFNLPVPAMEIQNKIVDILDRFDALCNNIAQGLPAEIADRQKQYEYYRDKLLTFKEKTV